MISAARQYPGGTVHVAMDESFDPVVCVGATVADSDFDLINGSVELLYEELTGFSWLDDLSSFRKFVAQGFHASKDPDDVSTRFIQFLAHSYGFSTMLFFSEASDRHPKRTTLLLYRSLLKTILWKYRRRPLICLYFEEGDDALEEYLPRVVASALRTVPRPRPAVEIKIHSKMDPPLSAICDYTMLSFARWYAGGYRDAPPMTLNRRHSTWRTLNALRHSVSVVRSLESGNLMRRALPFEEVAWEQDVDYGSR